MSPDRAPAPWLRRVFRLPPTPARARHELEDEMAFHLDERIDELMADGLSRADAEREARRRFGDMDAYRRQAATIDERMVHGRHRAELLDTLGRETRHAVRGLARSRTFALAAVIMLALGIGATTAIFTLLDRVVLQPLPFPHADRLVDIRSSVSGKTKAAHWQVSVAGYYDYRNHNHTFQDIGAYVPGDPAITGDGDAERVAGAATTASLLKVLGLRAELGRLYGPDDDRPGAPLVAVLGHGLWMRRYGGNPAVVGDTIRVQGSPVTVVGVASPDAQLPDRRVDLWVPLQLDSAAQPVNDHNTFAIGLLKPGATAAAAQRDLQARTALFPELYPTAYDSSFMADYHFAVDVIPTRSDVLGTMASALWILLAAVGVVLLIACANVANLFLVRLQARRRETALRAALGADRAHLAWHFLGESLVLSLAAGAVGLALAWSALHTLLASAPADLPRLAEVHLGWPGATFAFGLALLLGTCFGFLPLVRGADADVAALREGARGMTASRAQRTARSALVVAQVALALMLLAAAGLLLQSFRHYRSASPGLDPRRVLVFDVSLPESGRYGSYDAIEAFQRRLATALHALPAVASVGAITNLPFISRPGGCALVFVEDRPLAPHEQPPCLPTPVVTPGYFAAMGIPLQGREPSWDDEEQHAGGVVVSRALAERYWPGESPIGKGIKSNGPQPPFYHVVGIAGDVRAEGLDKPPVEAVYYPIIPIKGAPLWWPGDMTVAVRTRLDDPAALTGAIRKTVAEIDPELPIADARTMQSVVDRSMSRVSFTMLLLVVAAAMALVLSAVGIYGVVAYLVGQRRGEIGIRMALGARAGQVSRAVVLQSLGIAVIGVALGLAGAAATMRILGSLLFDVRPGDPLVLAAVSLILLAIAAAASAVPARRAARVSPVEALRAE